MRLYHRTNYWGVTINANDRDREVDMEAIWVQAVKRSPCCRGLGVRNVVVDLHDLNNLLKDL